MNKTYHIVTKAAKESAAIIEQFCQTNGQILLPIVNMIESASQVVGHRHSRNRDQDTRDDPDPER